MSIRVEASTDCNRAKLSRFGNAVADDKNISFAAIHRLVAEVFAGYGDACRRTIL